MSHFTEEYRSPVPFRISTSVNQNNLGRFGLHKLCFTVNSAVLSVMLSLLQARPCDLGLQQNQIDVGKPRRLLGIDVTKSAHLGSIALPGCNCKCQSGLVHLDPETRLPL